MDPLSLGLTLGLSGLASSYIQSRAARQASEAQAGMSQEAIAEQRRQFDEIRTLLSPFVQAGYTGMERLPGYITAGERAFEQQAALAGLSGPEAQRAAVEAISTTSPGFQESVRQGEEALLSRASATGGLRGGNIQAALAQFRPQMLEQAINQAYGRFGGLAGTGLGLTENLITRGQNAAGLSAEAGQQTGANIGNLLTQQGQAMAGGILGRAEPFAELAALPGQIAGVRLARGLFGGTQPAGGR
jgi:hypothetical protein